MNVYFISGLAADYRVFKNILLPPGFTAVHLNWIKPEVNETLAKYALRLAAGMDTAKPFALIGLSMGGMMAIEIAKHYPPKATILISSAAVFTQLPGRYSIARKLALHKLVPIGLLKNVSILKRLFGADNVADKKMLKQIIRDSDPAFIRWSLDAILHWTNTEVPHPLYHIHGTNDNVLPFKNIQPTHIIKNGSHLMVTSKAAEINEIIGKILLSVK